MSAWPYEPDERDRVVPLAGVPPSDDGAPLPVVLASDGRVILLYLAADPPEGWDGTWVRVVGPDTEGVPVVTVEFERPHAHLFGPPDEETVFGHPLGERGLHPCGEFVVEGSSWIRALERMSSVHDRHRPERFRELNHYVFTFHHSTFECAANGFRSSIEPGPLASAVARAAARLR